MITLAQPPSVEEINVGSERVTHLYPNDCYYARLSIYYFFLFNLFKIKLYLMRLHERIRHREKE
jgi:hypothetical protein